MTRTEKSAAQYRLLYLQPDPEAGERLCVGILFDDDLLFDKAFSKVQCLSREWRAGHLRLYLNEIRAMVRAQSSDLSLGLKRFAPLFSASSPRELVTPVTDADRLALYETYVEHRGTSDAAARRRAAFVEHLSKFASSSHLPPSTEVITNATGKQVLGRTRVAVNPVALAFRSAEHIVLLDGIDLNLDTPKIALRQASRITHTFWQYRTYGIQQDQEIKRVALVFNGNSHMRADLKDAHDFALRQFQTESDMVVDAAARGAESEVAEFLLENLL